MEYNPKIQAACPFHYYWRAIFEDGEEVAQYTGEGQEVPYHEVLIRLEAGKGLSFIELLPVYEGLPVYRQAIDSSWQRPVIFRRRFKRVGLWDGHEVEERILFALGWQATINDTNYKSVIYIDVDSGQVLITHRDW